MECRADKGLGTTMIEEYKNSPFRDHSATSTFFHAKRLFQGQDLPPSNAARAHSEPGDPPLPSRQYHARRGSSTSLFWIPLPGTSLLRQLWWWAYLREFGLRSSTRRQCFSEKQQGVRYCAQILAEYVRRNDVPSITVGEDGKVEGGIITAGKSASDVYFRRH
ncbi:hypothetical protein JOM56_005469 [Amanita muscaria]